MVVSPTISNVKMHHVLIDGGASLSAMSLHAFKALQIPLSKLTPSRPFGEVGQDVVIPYGSISLPVTFGTVENYRTEAVVFDIADFGLPFNAIIGRPALYRYMAVAHYGYLVLKIPAPNGVITLHTDHAAVAAAVEKLQALATTHIANQEDRDTEPPGPRLCTTAPRTRTKGQAESEGSRGGPSYSGPRVRPEGLEPVPTKVV